MEFIDPCCRCDLPKCRAIRPAVMGILAGLFFSVGWWLAIDGAVLMVVQQTEQQPAFVDFAPSMVGTFALFMSAPLF